MKKYRIVSLKNRKSNVSDKIMKDLENYADIIFGERAVRLSDIEKILKRNDKFHLNKKITFDEICVSAEDETTTMYFTAPKDLFGTVEYEDADYLEISVELPTSCQEACKAYVSVTPAKRNNDGTIEYFDWRDISLPYDEIEALIRLAEKSAPEKKSFLSHLKPITLWFWNENKNIGRNFKDVFEEIKNQLRKVYHLHELHYFKCIWEKELPSQFNINVSTHWGGNEGIYIDVTIKYQEGNQTIEKCLLRAKTLGRTPKDFEEMGRLATAIAYLLHC